MEFKIARFDKIATIVSIIVTLLLICLSIFFILISPEAWFISIAMILILLVSYLLSPKRYVFKGSNLIIEKVIGTKIIIPLNEVEGYVFIQNFAKLKPLRALGNGGLFGYYGFFSTSKYGNINCQLRNFKNVFIIKSKKGTYAISPLETEKFDNHFRTVMSGIAEKIEEIQPIKPELIKKANILILILPALIFVLTLIMLFSLYPQLPERIATHFNARGMPDGWASRNSFLLGCIIPSSLIFVLTIVLFFVFRAKNPEPTVPNFLVVVLSFIQAFITFVSFDIFWFNTHNEHFIPMWGTIIGFLVILMILLYYYYQKLKYQSK